MILMVEQQKKVNQFNRTFNVGDKIPIKFTPSVTEKCTVKAPSSIVGEIGVVFLKEINDYVEINRVKY